MHNQFHYSHPSPSSFDRIGTVFAHHSSGIAHFHSPPLLIYHRRRVDHTSASSLISIHPTSADIISTRLNQIEPNRYRYRSINQSRLLQLFVLASSRRIRSLPHHIGRLIISSSSSSILSIDRSNRINQSDRIRLPYLYHQLYHQFNNPLLLRWRSRSRWVVHRDSSLPHLLHPFYPYSSSHYSYAVSHSYHSYPIIFIQSMRLSVQWVELISMHRM